MMGAVNTKCRGRVLAIDDEPELLEIVKGSLEPYGFEVHTAASAQEGVEFYEQNWRNIDLVLLDYLMPGMTGDLVFECLKRENPDVRTLLLTGCEDYVAERMFKEGLWGYIHKPFVLNEFVQEVGEAIDSSEPARR
jgi:two-component system, cell cycle sensor histidine kinase and response regulator CckA